MIFGKTPLAFRRRLGLLRVLIVSGFLLLAVGYYRIQVLQGTHYQVLGERVRTKTNVIKASRGLIFDRANRLVTRNLPAYDLELIKDEMTEPWETFLPRLSQFLRQDPEILDRQFRKACGRHGGEPIVLMKNIDFGEVVRIWRNRTRYPGISIDVTTRRDYTHPSLLSHVLGYVGEATDQDLAENDHLRMGDMVGKRGIERAYDHLLTGREGELLGHINSQGQFFEERILRPPEPGVDLFLTIDLELQDLAAREMGDNCGTILLMDLRNGEILVLYSSPTYDLSLFSQRISAQQWQDLLSQSNHPLFNRPLQGLYAPGSIFKLVTALAALKRNVCTPQTKVTCTGSFSYYGRTFHCHDRNGHGDVDLMDAITESCNVYFYHLAKEIGAQALAETAQELGFGVTTGIDLIGEKEGVVPSPHWKNQQLGEIWYPGETLSFAIGQGDLQATPLQLLQLMALIAGDGTAKIPHLIKKYRRWDAVTPAPLKERKPCDIPAHCFDVVKAAMWRVVNLDDGTGSKAAIPGLDVCGKTGTAQLITFTNDAGEREDRFKNAWFAGFAPRQNPEVAVIVLVEHASAGGLNAAPIARQILNAYFRKKERSDPS